MEALGKLITIWGSFDIFSKKIRKTQVTSASTAPFGACPKIQQA